MFFLLVKGSIITNIYPTINTKTWDFSLTISPWSIVPLYVQEVILVMFLVDDFVIIFIQIMWFNEKSGN